MFESDGRFLVSHCCDLALLFGGIHMVEELRDHYRVRPKQTSLVAVVSSRVRGQAAPMQSPSSGGPQACRTCPPLGGPHRHVQGRPSGRPYDPAPGRTAIGPLGPITCRAFRPDYNMQRPPPLDVDADAASRSDAHALRSLDGGICANRIDVWIRVSRPRWSRRAHGQTVVA